MSHAFDLYLDRAREKNTSTLYDSVFCVIDRDSHPNFNKALDMINQFNKNLGVEKIFSIKSFPSFEYWYLCHFKYSRGTFSKSGKKSAGDVCVADLNDQWKRKYSEDYNKNDTRVYSKLLEDCDQAIINANRALSDAESTAEMNPSTEAHILVDYLRKIKSPKTR